MPDVKTIDTHTLKQWLEQGKAVLLDVREPDEYKAAHIEIAHLLPLAQVTTDALPDISGKTLVIQCQSGKRSATACAKLLTENPALDVYNLQGGIIAWHEAGMPVVFGRR